MPKVKNIKTKDSNNSYNIYPIGMNGEFVTIPAGTANLYENVVNADEGIGILENYFEEQLEKAKYSFVLNYTDLDDTVYSNVYIYNDFSENASELRSFLSNNISSEYIYNLDVREQYTYDNFVNASGLFLQTSYPFYIQNINSIDFQKVTNTSNMFRNQLNLQYINVLNLGNNVTEASSMFANCYNLVNIPNFYTSNITNARTMFYNCYNLVNLQDMDFRNVENAGQMFHNCYNLENIGNLQIEKASDISLMFTRCHNLTNIDSAAASFNTSNAKTMAQMFYNCYNLTHIPNFLDTSNVTNMKWAFGYCRNITTADNLNTANATDMNRVFTSCPNLINVYNIDTSSAEDVQCLFYNCYNLTTLPKFELNNVILIQNMIYNCSNLTNESVLNIANSLPYYANIEDEDKSSDLSYVGFSFNQIMTIDNNYRVRNYVTTREWTFPNVTYQLAYTTVDNTENWISLSIENQAFSNNAQNLKNYINNSLDYNQVYRLNIIDLPGITNGYNLFSNGTNLTTVNVLNMPALLNMRNMFYNCRNLISINNINCNDLQDVSFMFGNCRNLPNMPDFSNINSFTNFYMMFTNCVNLVNIINYNTTNVNCTDYMFYNCQNLVNAPNFDLSNCRSVNYMFWNCRRLVNIPNYNLINLTSVTATGLFMNCFNLVNAPHLIFGNKIYGAPELFRNCINLVNVPDYDFQSTEYFENTFRNCTNLVNAPNLTFSNAFAFPGMFANCVNLVNVPLYNIVRQDNKIILENMFLNCNNLSTASLDNIANFLPTYESCNWSNDSSKTLSDVISNATFSNLSNNAINVLEEKGWMVFDSYIRVDYTYSNGETGFGRIYNVDAMNGTQIRSNLVSLLNSHNLTSAKDIAISSRSSTNLNISTLNRLFYLNYPLLETLDLSGLDTSQTLNLESFASHSTNLINVSNFNTTNVTNMYFLFYGCNNLSEIPNFDTSNVTDMGYAFLNCFCITNIPSFNTSKVTSMRSTFMNCYNLTDLPVLNMQSLNIYNNSSVLQSTFYDCNSLSLNALKNIVISIPNAYTYGENFLGTTNLNYLITDDQINMLPEAYRIVAASKYWVSEGYDVMGYGDIEVIPIANSLGDISYENTEYPMTYNDPQLESTNQNIASSSSSATITVTEEMLELVNSVWKVTLKTSSEEDYDILYFYKNDELIGQLSGTDVTTVYAQNIPVTQDFYVEVEVGDKLFFTYIKDSSVDEVHDTAYVQITAENKTNYYEVRYSTVDSPTTYTTTYVSKEDG